MAPKSPSLIKNVLNLFSGRFFGGLALVFADFGLRFCTLKEVSRHRQAAKDRYSEIVATTLTNAAITLACFILVVLIAPITDEAKWILALIQLARGRRA